MQLLRELTVFSASIVNTFCKQTACESSARRRREHRARTRNTHKQREHRARTNTMRVLTKHLSRKIKETNGQGTVEYALVLAALLVIVLGLGALGHLFMDGSDANHALASASHHVDGSAVVATLDVFAF